MAVLTRKREVDLTHGSILRGVIAFVLPLMLTNLLQTFYNAADMMVVSLSTEENAVGAISTTGAFFNLIVNLFIGLSVGANVVVARHVGAGDTDGTRKAVHTSMLMSLLFGLVGLLIGQATAAPVLQLMGVEHNLFELALIYLRLVFSGIPFLAVTNYAVAIFRAKGDSKTPLYVLMLAGLLNVLLNLFFVLVCGMSVEGVALATMLSNLAAAVVLVWKLFHQEDATRLAVSDLHIDRSIFREILGIGIPAGVQGAVFSVSNMLIQSSILQVDANACPPDILRRPVVNGNGAAANLEGFAYTATNAIYQGAVTFTGQNLGAKQYDRLKRGIPICYLLTFCTGLLVSGFILLFHQPLLSLYGVVPDTSGSLAQMEFDTALLRFRIMLTTYVLLALMETGSGFLRGLGKSLTSAVITIFGTCVVRVIWIYTVFAALGTLSSIYVSYPISWAACAIAHFTFTIIALRKITKTHTEN